MAPNGPPGDFSNQPTQHAGYGGGEHPPPGAPPPPPPPPPEQFEAPYYLDPLDDSAEPTPWYRKPVGLISWGVLVVILIGLIVYGIVELIHGGQGTSNTPSTTTTTIPSTSSPTTTTTPPPPPSTATTTTPSTSPPTSSAAQPAPQPTWQPTHQPTHRHHLPSLPSVITIPEIPTVITLPPGLP